MASNLVVPVVWTRSTGKPFISNTVLVSHPDDCERIAKTHVKKMVRTRHFHRH